MKPFLVKVNNHFLNKTLFLTIYWIENENGEKHFKVKLNCFHWYTITWFFLLKQVTFTWLHQVSASTIRIDPPGITVALTLHLAGKSAVASITMETKGISHKLPMTFRGEFNISTHKSSFNLMIQSILNPYSTFNAYSIFNALFNFQWTMFNAYSKFSKPFNVQWGIRCSTHIQYSMNHSILNTCSIDICTGDLQTKSLALICHFINRSNW